MDGTEPMEEAGVVVGSDDLNTVILEDEETLTVSSPLSPLIDIKSGYVVLGRSASANRKWGKKGTLEVGVVGEHQNVGEDLSGRRVLIDAAFPHIVFICGKRGSGKSYTLGILAEELVKTSIGVGVVLIDPIGIFWSLKKENGNTKEIEILKKWGFSSHSFPEVKVLVPGSSGLDVSFAVDGPYTIGVGEMTEEDWCQVFDIDRFKTQGLLIGTAMDQVKNGYAAVLEGKIETIPGRGSTFSIGDLVQCIKTSLNLTSKQSGFTPQTRRSMIARFNAASSWGIFSVQGTALREITSSNRITVIDVSNPKLGDAKRSLITGIIARKILSSRIYSARMEDKGVNEESDPEMIPVTWLLIDEAHVILPHNRQTPAAEALIEYAKQGRRPGCALILATQRPASTNDDILSQVDLLIGHNLALEDDMSALRRRVPAKLPAEFSNSDFIRAIPVGTAIIADQKTQQRSFLLKLRPRFSHHAGRSAMPKALSEKKMVDPVPITGTYQEVESHPVDQPTPIPGSDAGKQIGVESTAGITPADTVSGENLNEIETGIEDVKWGSSLLLQNHSMEEVRDVLTDLPGGTKFTLFARNHPSRVPLPPDIDLETAYWLSSTPGEGAIAPSGLQEISLEAGKALRKQERHVILFDGVEYLYMNNGPNPVQKLFENLHEKVFLGKHLLVVRIEGGLDEDFLNRLKLEMDVVLTSSAGKSDKERTAADDIEPAESTDSDLKADDRDKRASGDFEAVEGLSHDDLVRMCGILDLPSDGEDPDLMKRILDYQSVMGIQGKRTDGTRGISKDELESAVDNASRYKKERAKLEDRIKELEVKLRIVDEVPDKKETKTRPHKKRKKKKKNIILEWDEDQEGSTEQIERALKSIMTEITGMKKELTERKVQMDRSRNIEMDPSVSDLLNGISKESAESLDRLDRLEVQLKVDMSEIREEIDGLRVKGAEKTVPEAVVMDETSSAGSAGPSNVESLPPSSKKIRVPKMKVVKKGAESVVVNPRISTKDATEAAKKTLKRSFLRGPRERIEEVLPVYIPVYRCLVSYRTKLLRDWKDGDIFIDGLTGEVLEEKWNGLKRSSGVDLLLKMTPLEARIFGTLGGRGREDTYMSRKAGVELKSVRRVMTTLQKKGIVKKEVREGGINVYYKADSMEIPQSPWKNDSGIHPISAFGIEEPFADPLIPEKQVSSIISLLSGKVKLMEIDMVRYPYFAVKIAGEGRIRYVAVNGVSGKVDKDITPLMKTVISGLEYAK
ncbi:MAG: DUF835 domain-containing protein [Thermoplasmatota archaeon]